ncbi:threonine synthase [Thermoflavimicrobium daqui]|uniref:Threonine synthase n=1 Tax=Thermoflavimicrobium daqui TaxID=2137476 RepID=A0A364KA37_9BACL|nr:threonine synthase [Thermoflavimicrobium daqui]RAL27090.1 threonine synthase [Thermoflavimicrobium daqui]
MPFSYVSHLTCPKCKRTYSVRKKQQLCFCGSPLLVEYQLEELKKNLSPTDIGEREPSLWRYHELLPIKSADHIVSLGEGMTPLIPTPKLGRNLSIPNLYIKDEGTIPTGSFKARGAAVGISKAKELGIRELAMPTNGNAGAAWALYAARADMKATIVLPVDAPTITRAECSISGAKLHLIHGRISDAGKIVAQMVAEKGIYDVSTLKEPYRIEGKKTMGIEIAEQFNWKLPDVILYPTGGGVGLIGIYKSFKELQNLGWIQGRLPRLVAVQSTGCAPIVKAWKEKKNSSEFCTNSTTVAFGINVPKALGDFLVLEAIYQTDGCAVAVDDDMMLQEQKRVASLEGLFICPEGAATIAAARVLRENGWIQEQETVVALNTGLGLKYPNTVQIDTPVLLED